MRLLARTVIISVVLGLVWAVVGIGGSTTPAYACTCTVRSDDQLLSGADVVFTGTITADDSQDRTRLITFAVDRVYKGSATTTQIVQTDATGGSCGLGLGGPGEFLVLAQAGGGRQFLTADLCGGSRTGPAPATLGPGNPPQPDASAPGSAQSRNRRTATFVVVGLLCIAAAVYVSRRPPGFQLPRLGTKR